jgi:hypothetical protein
MTGETGAHVQAAGLDDARRAFERQRFVEELGTFFELVGFSRMAGRVWGFLLVSEEPEVSAADLADGLAASGGSISTATRALLRGGMIRRVRRPNQRRAYFTLDAEAVPRAMTQRLAVVSSMVALAARGLEVFGDSALVRTRLEELHDFYAWMERELPVLMERWQQERGASTAGGGRGG